MPERDVSVRLSVVGGGRFRSEITNAGQSGERAMRRITQATAPASGRLRVLDGVAREVRFGMESMAVRSGLAGSALRGLGGAGLVAAVGIAAAGAAITSGFRASAEEEQRLLRLEAVLRATGETAGITASEIADLAREQERATLITEAQFTEATAILATFRAVQNEEFRRALLLGQDLAAVFGVDMRQSMQQLGKALEDPIRGISALRRVGVSFTQTQRDQIAAMVEAGNIAAAQGVILDTLALQVGGAAGAEAQGLSGAFHRARSALGDFNQALAETSGLASHVERGMNGFAHLFFGFADRIQDLRGETPLPGLPEEFDANASRDRLEEIRRQIERNEQSRGEALLFPLRTERDRLTDEIGTVQDEIRGQLNELDQARREYALHVQTLNRMRRAYQSAQRDEMLIVPTDRDGSPGYVRPETEDARMFRERYDEVAARSEEVLARIHELERTANDRWDTLEVFQNERRAIEQRIRDTLTAIETESVDSIDPGRMQETIRVLDAYAASLESEGAEIERLLGIYDTQIQQRLDTAVDAIGTLEGLETPAERIAELNRQLEGTIAGLERLREQGADSEQVDSAIELARERTRRSIEAIEGAERERAATERAQIDQTIRDVENRLDLLVQLRDATDSANASELIDQIEQFQRFADRNQRIEAAIRSLPDSATDADRQRLRERIIQLEREEHLLNSVREAASAYEEQRLEANRIIEESLDPMQRYRREFERLQFLFDQDLISDTVALLSLQRAHDDLQDALALQRRERLDASPFAIDGARRALDRLTEDATTAADIMEEALTGSFDSVERAIREAATNGTVDWNEMARSMLADLSVLLVRMLVLDRVARSIAIALGGQPAPAPIIPSPLPTYHTGSNGPLTAADLLRLPGMGADEGLAKLRVGEEVLTPAQSAARAMGAGRPIMAPQIEVHVSNLPAELEVKPRVTGFDGARLTMELAVERRVSETISRGGADGALRSRFGNQPRARRT